MAASSDLIYATFAASPAGSRDNVVSEVTVLGSHPSTIDWLSLNGIYQISPSLDYIHSSQYLASVAAFRYILNNVDITANTNNPSDQEVVSKAVGQIIKNYMAAYAFAYDNLMGGFEDPLGHVVSASQLVQEMNNITWHITDAPLPGGVAGNTQYNPGSSHVDVNISVIGSITTDPSGSSYNNLNGGIEYVVDHELGHAFSSGHQVSSMEVANYIARTGDANLIGWNADQPEFMANQAYANSLGKDIATFTGAGWLAADNPGNGYFHGLF